MGAAPLFTPIPLARAEFDFFRARVQERAGISLSEAKIELVQARLRPRLVELGLTGYSGYVSYLQTLPPEHEEWQTFVNSLTTNKTDWFREPQHFDLLVNDFLPRWFKLGKKKLKVWCAASSTGEEPYTLALVLDKALRESGADFEILATDIDTEVLSHARRGVYPRDRLFQIPPSFQSGFDFGTGEISDWMRVKKRIKDKIRFERFNLISSAYPWKSEFDFIFCRNVMIYFNEETTRLVVTHAFQAAAEHSALIIAHSESLQNIKSPWAYLQPSIYVKGTKISY